MLEFGDIYRLLRQSVSQPPTGDAAHIAGIPTSGVAAQALVGFAATPDVKALTAQVAGDSAIFEGQVRPVSTGTWAATEVVDDAYGVPIARAGLVEGMRIYAGNTATRVTALTNDGSDHWTGETIDAIAPSPPGGSLDIYAMSLSARLDHTASSAYWTFFSPDYGQDIAAARLDGLYSQIAVGDTIIVEAGDEIGVTTIVLAETTTATVEEAKFPISLLFFAPAPIPDPSEEARVRIWFNAKKAGTLARIPSKTVRKSDFVEIARPVTLTGNATLPPADTPILIRDAEGTTIQGRGGGQLIAGVPHITVTALGDPEFDDELVKPITFIWGLTRVTRGQTVQREVLGSGDATQAWQSFRLAKSPLTHVADPFAPGGRRPELAVYVNGVEWRRASSFYKTGPRDEIYVVRHDGDNRTHIQFGDGELGKRLPTGTNNVIATYRFGVGGNVAANTITKISRPIIGVSSVYNPLPAVGGEDPPTAAEAREQAIQSTRVLGRLVALVDFEVEAARYGGVLKARARWAWNRAGDDALVEVWIVCRDDGDPSAELRGYLRSLAEPGVRVEVHKAKPYAGELTIDLELDPAYLPDEVRAAVDARLFDEFTGILAPRNAPIGGAFHRSELFAAIHEVAGVRSVQGVFIDGKPMPRAVVTGAGQYLALAYPAVD